MASKAQMAKEAQGYTTELKNCGNCVHHTCTLTLPEWMRGNARYDKDGEREKHMRESNQRCGIGGFAIKKTATCSQWAKKAEA
jgi:hypothetical protein